MVLIMIVSLPLKSVQDEILKTFKVLDKLETKELIEARRAKYNEMGIFND